MHWTYEAVGEAPDLRQGDIIELQTDVEQIVSGCRLRHANVALLVVTQSCDLVRRDSRCTAEAISLSPVVPVTLLLDSWAGRLCRSLRKDSTILDARDRDRFRDRLGRVLDQNEQSLGLFYLHPDPDATIRQAAVALLRESIWVPASTTEYAALIAGRRAALSEGFRAKLGWLVANLYGRAATRDWADDDVGKRIRGEMLDEWIRQFDWLHKSYLQLLEALDVVPNELSDAELLTRSKQPTPAAADVVGSAVIECLRKVNGVSLTDSQAQQFMSLFRQSPKVKRALLWAGADPSLGPKS